MALSCEPKVLVADEPTTALDVSIQAQILELLRRITEVSRTSLLMVSHDLSVVAGLADRIAVMYAGEIVESGPTAQVFDHPRHPYTLGLLACIPRLDFPRTETLRSIEGPPDWHAVKVGVHLRRDAQFEWRRSSIRRPRGKRRLRWPRGADLAEVPRRGMAGAPPAHRPPGVRPHEGLSP